jgi:hypothetical protein
VRVRIRLRGDDAAIIREKRSYATKRISGPRFRVPSQESEAQVQAGFTEVLLRPSRKLPIIDDLVLLKVTRKSHVLTTSEWTGRNCSVFDVAKIHLDHEDHDSRIGCGQPQFNAVWHRFLKKGESH